MTDEHPPWERQPWDSSASFDRFHTFYLAQDAPRSVDEAYRRYLASVGGLQRGYNGATSKRAPGVWRRWSRAQDSSGKPIPDALSWEERASAYDDHRAELDRRAWQTRRRNIREEDYQRGAKLRELGDQLLSQTPQFLKTTRRSIKGQGGQPDREIITISLDGMFLLRTVKLASELQRLAAEMVIEQREVSGQIQFFADDLAKARDRARQFEEQLLGGAADTAMNN